jgi:fluoride exporter
MRLIVISAGGFIGTMLRYLVSGAVQSSFSNITFPFGTAVVNISGCFVIGFLAELAESRGVLTDATRAFLMVGVLGGYTTFSAFGNETMNLFRSGESFLGLVNVVFQVVLGLACVWLGRDFAHLIWR